MPTSAPDAPARCRRTRRLTVAVPVMDIREMGMGVAEQGVDMRVRVRLPHWLRTIVRMLVMLVVDVSMTVGEGLVHVFVRVPLCEM